MRIVNTKDTNFQVTTEIYEYIWNILFSVFVQLTLFICEITDTST